MTVCIAAISPELRRVFLVADQKIGNQSMAVDGGSTKARAMTADGRWTCLFACDDTTVFRSLHGRIVAALRADGNVRHDVGSIMEAVRASYDDELDRLAGRANNATTTEPISTRVQLLIVGFDPNDTPHILVADDHGATWGYDEFGFGAIGEGADTALASLQSNRDFLQLRSVGLVIFRLCEAKFLANAAFESVGKSTTVMTIDPDGTTTQAPDETIEAARQIWQRRREAMVPRRLLTALTAGYTFDSSGEYVLGASVRRHAELFMKYQRVTLEIDAMRATRQFPDDWLRRAESLSDRIETLSNQITQVTDAWEATKIRPAGLVNLLAWNSEAITELESLTQPTSDPPQTAYPAHSKPSS